MTRSGIFRTAALAATGAAALSTGCAYNWHGPLETETRVIEIPHEPDQPLSVATRNGRVTVREGGVNSVEVTAEVKARTVERLLETRVVAERQPDGTLLLTHEFPTERLYSGEGASFEVAIPDVSRVYVDTSNGRITLEGLGGVAELDTSNGRVTVTDFAGDVIADTSNGGIRMERIGGSVEVDTSNGGIVLREIAGAVEADTSNGRVDIALDRYSAGPINVDTSNGGVELTFGPAFEGELVLDTSNGRVHLDADQIAGALTRLKIGKRHAVIALGESQMRSRVETSNGSIRVRFAEPE